MTTGDDPHRLRELEGRLADLERRTGLVSSNFLVRAFTVWGHYFVANLLISLVMVGLFLLVLLAFGLLGAFFAAVGAG